MNKTLISLTALALLLGAGSAVATGGSLGGTQDLGTDVKAHADYSGVLSAVAETKDQVTGLVDQAASVAGSAQAKAAGEARHNIDIEKDVTVDAKQGLMDGIGSNLGAMGAWFQGLFVKPVVDAKHAEDADALLHTIDDVQNHDGSLDAYYGQDLTSTARVDYNIPPPPTPDTGFLHSLKLAFAGALHFE